MNKTIYINYHFLQGARQATTLPFFHTLRSPNPLFSFVGQEFKETAQVVGMQEPVFTPRGTILIGRL